MAAPAVPFKRRLRVGMSGVDVEGVGRALSRAGYLTTWKVWMAALPVVRRKYGDAKVRAVRLLQNEKGLVVSGDYTLATHNKLRATRKKGSATEWAFDAKAAATYASYVPPPPPLIEPNQGWSSLSKELWALFSNGRARGLSDAGTYNPASTLPGGGKSDHAVFPAKAFDLGCSPQTGQRNRTAKAFFDFCVGRPEVEYVILGDKIWSRDRGLHEYAAGNHDGHVHVSGNR